ncbi:eukaryotic translation initiation factor 3 subunit H-B isoform X4 [Onychostoma macrolepis]|uniref:eukaryotic translation initiation factor 3 subunit H-B isoform X4 n=1 Tax=Onychostoma macrolepis TaxID=369639 RepID=UPI002729E61E|nr:eukaryotic translation initiation factor 3 subunit H-B isoform X4 [Onychostoma macrolepis]
MIQSSLSGSTEGTGVAVLASPARVKMASRKETPSGKTPDSPVKQIQIEGLVVMKIIKHYQEEGQGSEVVQGVLLGLVVEDRLEITNCFPFPQHTEDDADFDEAFSDHRKSVKIKLQYQMEMMRSLRHVNIDHLHVGWYQSTFNGSFVSRALLDSQFSYQHAIEESVVLIYDPIKTAQGSLCLKAYRLTPKLMEICKEKDFSADGLKKASVGYENMFEEVPIVIKNSHLISVLLWELEDKSTAADKHELLNLSSSTHLEKSLQMLMDRMDDMSQDIVKYNNYCRSLSKQQQQKHQYIQRRQQENAQRQSRGEPLLPEEDLSKMFKPPQPPPRMDTLLICSISCSMKQ